MESRKWQIAFTAGVVALVVASTFWLQSRLGRTHAAEGTHGRVAVARFERRPLKNVLTLSVEFKPFQDVDIHAKVAGYIRKISVDVGDHVKAGQVLAVLEVPELNAQVAGASASILRSQDEIHRTQSELQRDRSAHEAAHSAYERLRQASEARPGLIAQQELDDAQAKDREAEAQVEATQAAISASQQRLAEAKANHQQVSALEEYSRITAPFDGVVTMRYADTGSLIQAGTSSNTQAMPVVRLAEWSRLRLVIPVTESAVPQVHLGSMVQVRVGALNRTFGGKVSRFADDLDRQTRTMHTEIDVDNSDGSLVAGMYAETDITVHRKEDALSVPLEAVSREGSEATVLVVGAGNKLEERTVTLGLEGPRRIEVLSGLRENEQVVIGSRSQFRVGEQVEPKPVAKQGANLEAEL